MDKLLIIGLGDVAKRALPLLSDWVVDTPIRSNFDLDAPDFQALPKHCDAMLYTAPPPNHGEKDPRLFALLEYWHTVGGAPKHIVYISTSGVYGDCAGDWVDETCPLKPHNSRAKRRAYAEQILHDFAQRNATQLTILRAPGIYAAERLPLQRIKDGVPILLSDEDGYTNHIHADDLAMMCVAALRRPMGIQTFNASDDLPLKVGDWFTALAIAFQLPAPERLSRAALQQRLTAIQWSFMAESRRLSNAKIKSKLEVALRFPSVLSFLAELQAKKM